ncbi:GntR family transcriptional regulator [Bradyrhizobium sp. NBAIM08]|uniref:GntR family transcriptional regulator n=1 Tax=Bradyrhizobium sp. NBAIM08 TaxID=2793815 RepID=UPI001CD5C43C|nr:GntR family transcriptional regulator [Bradyrhizobium sp. NBAIM08]
MELSSDCHVPKYAQIADIFRQRIARGVWTQGFRLPANEELAAEFAVSRVTIRQAVKLLARDGVIEAQQGRGTLVTGPCGRIRHTRSTCGPHSLRCCEPLRKWSHAADPQSKGS